MAATTDEQRLAQSAELLEKLLGRNGDLSRTIEGLRKGNAQTREENTRLNAENSRLASEADRLSGEAARLQTQIIKLEQAALDRVFHTIKPSGEDEPVTVEEPSGETSI